MFRDSCLVSCSSIFAGGFLLMLSSVLLASRPDTYWIGSDATNPTGAFALAIVYSICVVFRADERIVEVARQVLLAKRGTGQLYEWAIRSWDLQVAPGRSQRSDLLQRFPIGHPQGQIDLEALHFCPGAREKVPLSRGVVEDHQPLVLVAVVVPG